MSVKTKLMQTWLESQIGEPYVWGAKGPDSWDCSGLSWGAYNYVGIKLPHGSYNQATQGREIPASSAHFGCLVFKKRKDGRIFHVAVVGNDNTVYEARGKKWGVVHRKYNPTEWQMARKIDALYAA